VFALFIKKERSKVSQKQNKRNPKSLSISMREPQAGKLPLLLCVCVCVLSLSLSLCFALSLKLSDSSLRGGVSFLPECVYLSPSACDWNNWRLILERWLKMYGLMMVLADSGFYLKAQWNTNFLWNLVFVGLDGG
jgi:hypothetical protein